MERQIRAAQDRGAFDNLPGAGKPLPKRSDDVLEWVAEKLRSEETDSRALLPPSLQLRKELEELPIRLSKVRTEREVRDIVKDLNTRIRAEILLPHAGPPLLVRLVDVEEEVERWHASR